MKAIPRATLPLLLTLALTACSSDNSTQLKTLEQENTRLKAQVDQLLEENKALKVQGEFINRLATQAGVSPQEFVQKLEQGLSGARVQAQQRSVQAYTQNVYKAAYAYAAESEENKVISGDCSSGYTVGQYSVPANSEISSCTVSGTGEEPDVAVIGKDGYRSALP